MEALYAKICEAHPCAAPSTRYWFIASLGSECSIYMHPAPTPRPLAAPLTPVAHEATIRLQCREPQSLVKAVKEVVNVIEGCRGVGVRLEDAVMR